MDILSLFSGFYVFLQVNSMQGFLAEDADISGEFEVNARTILGKTMFWQLFAPDFFSFSSFLIIFKNVFQCSL